MSFVVYVLATLKELISNKSAAEEQSKHTARPPPPPRRKHALRDAHILLGLLRQCARTNTHPAGSNTKYSVCWIEFLQLYHGQEISTLLNDPMVRIHSFVINLFLVTLKLALWFVGKPIWSPYF
jgi:hypothetical protein